MFEGKATGKKERNGVPNNVDATQRPGLAGCARPSTRGPPHHKHAKGWQNMPPSSIRTRLICFRLGTDRAGELGMGAFAWDETLAGDPSCRSPHWQRLRAHDMAGDCSTDTCVHEKPPRRLTGSG